jgi:hypothetical protein
MFEEEEDQQVGGGFYSFTSASAISEEGSEGVSGGVGHWQLDLDASSRVPAIDQFIDTKHLTSVHVLEPPTTGTGAGAGAGAGEGGKSFVQHGQEQFEEGEKCKFVDAVKAKQHYSLAALYFRKAADELKEITVQLVSCLCIAYFDKHLASWLMCGYIFIAGQEVSHLPSRQCRNNVIYS